MTTGLELADQIVGVAETLDNQNAAKIKLGKRSMEVRALENKALADFCVSFNMQDRDRQW